MKKLFVYSFLPLFVFSIASALKITPSIYKVSVDKTLNDTAKLETNCLSPVFVNIKINSINDLEKLNESSPSLSNVILYLNSDLNLVSSENNTSLNIHFMDAYDTYLKGKYLPVFYINDEETKTNFITYLNDTEYIVDSAVCSFSYSIVKDIRSSSIGKYIRGIIDLSNVTKEEFDKKEIVKETNKAFANTIILSEELSTYENIRYFLARFKSVWSDQDSYEKLKTMELINNGIYGIVSKNYDEVISTFSEYLNSPNSKWNVNRAAFNIAHRGACTSNFENSLEGFKEAFSNGATHIELDIHVTKDKELVVMHDTTLNRTTNYGGSLSIKDMTKEEIKKYKITKNYVGTFPPGVKDSDGVEIPFLDEVFAEFKDNNKVIIVELKCDDEDLVSLFKECLDTYDIYDQLVVISFYEDQLKLMKELIPEIPCATLNNRQEGMFNKTTSDGVIVLNMNNFGSDFNQGVYSETFDRKLAERGFLGYYWTYTNASAIYTALSNGVLGVTNNAYDTFKDLPIKLITPSSEITYDTSIDMSEFTYPFNYETYTGSDLTNTVDSKIVSYVDKGDYLEAIFGGYFTTSTSPRYKGVIFSNVVKVNKIEGTNNNNNNNNNEDNNDNNNSNLGLIIGLSVGGVILITSLTIGALLFIKRKHK